MSHSVILFENDHAIVVPEKSAISLGHLLVISKQHFDDWFVTPPEVQKSMHDLLQQAHGWLLQQHKPDGFSMWSDCGEAAGQAVLHSHYDIIPRYTVDQTIPTGHSSDTEALSKNFSNA